MKKLVSIVLAAAMMLTLLTACGGGGSSSTPSGDGTFTPSTEVNWICTSSPGGGSDIYTRMITDIMTKQSWVTKTFLVENITDGAGEIGRNQVATTKAGEDADHTLLTFNSGDLMPMVQNTKNRVANFTPIAIMAVDKQLLFTGPGSKYASFADVLKAVKAGTVVTIAGSKGDDVATYEALIAELGVSKDVLKYVTHDGTGDAIAQVLGKHYDMVISKPAAASQYVESTDAATHLTPILALSTERYTGNLSDAPTLSEVDSSYEDVEVPIWRGVVGPKNMSAEAAAFWSGVLKQVSESDTWKTDYLEKNKLISNYMTLEETQKFMAQYETDYLATLK